MSLLLSVGHRPTAGYVDQPKVRETLSAKGRVSSLISTHRGGCGEWGGGGGCCRKGLDSSFPQNHKVTPFTEQIPEHLA